MAFVYLRDRLINVHLIRLLTFAVFLILVETRLSWCSSSLNEYLGFNQNSILFYYILIWVSFSFEIYFLVNRLFGSTIIKARRSSIILYCLLAAAFAVASALTLYAMIHRTDGHVITQHDLSENLTERLPVSILCNRMRSIGVVFGFVFSFLYIWSIIFICRLQKWEGNI